MIVSDVAGPAAVYAGLRHPVDSHCCPGFRHFGLVFHYSQVQARRQQHLVDDVDHAIGRVDVHRGDSGVLDHDLAVADGDIQALTRKRLQRRHVFGLVLTAEEPIEDIEDV